MSPAKSKENVDPDIAPKIVPIEVRTKPTASKEAPKTPPSVFTFYLMVVGLSSFGSSDVVRSNHLGLWRANVILVCPKGKSIWRFRSRDCCGNVLDAWSEVDKTEKREWWNMLLF